MADINKFVSLDEIYPDQGSEWRDLAQLLRGLSRTDVLFCCARLNHLLTNHSSKSLWDRQKVAVEACFGDLALYKILNAMGAAQGAPRAVFFRGQMIELFRWAALVCEDAADDGETFKSSMVRERFGRAALVASDIWARRVFAGLHEQEDVDLDSLRRRAIGPFRKGIEGAQTAPGLEILGRGRIFTEFVPPIQPQFTDYFKEYTGLSVEEYLGCCATVMAHYMRSDSDASIFDSATLSPRAQEDERVQTFLRLEGRSVDDLRGVLWGTPDLTDIPQALLNTFDYRPLRERPILIASDGRATFIDPIFMADKASVGPLFHVVGCRPPKEAKKWFGVFGEAFERYAQEVLRRVVPKPSQLLFDPLCVGLEGYGSEGPFEVDACLNYGDDLIIFEMKASWLRECEFGPGLHEDLLATLRQKYSKAEDGNKGIGQLSRIAGSIARGEWCGSDNVFQEVRRIIPVLMVHDRLCDVPGFGPFAATEFTRALPPDRRPTGGEMIKGNLRVLMPIVLTIDDLELMEVSSEHFGIRDVLIDYSQAHPDRLLSFRYFLSMSPRYKSRLYASRFLASGAISSLQNAMRTMFGVKTGESTE